MTPSIYDTQRIASAKTLDGTASLPCAEGFRGAKTGRFCEQEDETMMEGLDGLLLGCRASILLARREAGEPTGIDEVKTIEEAGLAPHFEAIDERPAVHRCCR